MVCFSYFRIMLIFPEKIATYLNPLFEIVKSIVRKQYSNIYPSGELNVRN